MKHYGRIVRLAATEDAAAALQLRLEFAGLPVIRLLQIEGLGASHEAVLLGVDSGLCAVAQVGLD
jgi:hypothetical protein